MATFDDFKAKYPELVSEGDGNQVFIESCLDEAAVVVDLTRCPKLADAMQMAYAAHCVAKSSHNPQGMDTGSGPQESASVGSVSVSYKIGDSTGKMSDWYRSTSYGQDFLRYLTLCTGAAIITAP